MKLVLIFISGVILVALGFELLTHHVVRRAMRRDDNMAPDE